MVNRIRTVSTLTTGFLLALGVLLGGLVSAPQPPAMTPVFDPATCLGYCKNPTNAGKVFRWGNAAWRQEWLTWEAPAIGDPGKNWQANKQNLIEKRGGMLALIAGERDQDLTAWATDTNARYGRWEARVRAKRFSTAGNPYRFFWELAPVKDQHCGAQNIVIASYQIGDDRVHGAVRNRSNAFTFDMRRDLQNKAWHTYAVEVTPDRISWFVDTQVILTERRPAALSGARFSVRFRMVAKRGARMNPGRMQMDWIRYYTLERKNARSIAAPRAHRGTYRSAC